jgi:biotin carboxylase
MMEAADGSPRVSIPRDLYERGCVHSVEEAMAAAQRIGLPVMIKASEGGGGKGIRKVESEDSLPALYRQVSVCSLNLLLFSGNVETFPLF